MPTDLTEPQGVSRRGCLGLEYGLAILAYAVAILVFAPGMDDILRFGLSDNNHYLFLAESLEKGNGYRDIFSIHQDPETRIPPGHPLVLAAIIRVRGLDIPVMKIVQVGFHFLAGLFFLLTFLRASSSRWEAVLGFTLGLICPLSVMHSRDISAETPYTFCVAFCLWLFARSAPRIPSSLALRLSGLTIAAAVMFRIQGLALWLSVLSAVAIAKHGRLMSRAFLARIFKLSLIPAFILAAWLVRNYLVSAIPGTDYVYWFMGVHPGGETEHPMHLAAFFNMVRDNLGYYLNLLYRIAFPPEQILRPVTGERIFEILVLVGLLWGLVKNLRSPHRIVGIYYLIFALMIIGWVFQVDNYSTSTLYIIPWLMVIGWNDLVFRRLKGMRPFARRPRLRLFLPAIFATAWIGALLFTDYKIIDHTIPNTIYPPMRVGPRYQVAAPVVGMEQMRILMKELKELDDKGILMCHSPQHMARVLGRPCLDIPILPPEEMLQYMEKENVRYVMIDQMFLRTRENLLPVVNRYRDRFQMKLILRWPTPQDQASVWVFSPQPGELKGLRP